MKQQWTKRPFSTEEAEIISQLASGDRMQHDSDWLQERAQTILGAFKSERPVISWGWKEPNTHMFLDKLLSTISGMKYIHVARNGLDMAFSKNQNQPKLWGPLVLNSKSDVTPQYSLKFWCWAHQRVLSIGEKFRSRFLFVNFDELCVKPESGIRDILLFAGIEPSDKLLADLTGLISPPASIGRYKNSPSIKFDPEDLNFVKKLGFDTSV